MGERWLAASGLEWTVVRPGGLKETEEGIESDGIRFSGPEQQESNSIPQRLVARVCLDAVVNPAASGRIIEITSSPQLPAVGLAEWLASSAA